MSVVSGGTGATELQIDGILSVLEFNTGSLSVSEFDAESAIGTAFHETWPVYSGTTTVVPKMDEEQTLSTAGKVVVDDITVTKVPFYEVTNQTGGTTCYIAMEIE